jgi:hypothetical protein
MVYFLFDVKIEGSLYCYFFLLYWIENEAVLHGGVIDAPLQMLRPVFAV